MPVTLNIFLSEEQKVWLITRRDVGGFSSSSDVVRALIRDAQERDQTSLLKEFRDLESDGNNTPEPAAEVLRLVKQIKKSRRAKAACHS